MCCGGLQYYSITVLQHMITTVVGTVPVLIFNNDFLGNQKIS